MPDSSDHPDRPAGESLDAAVEQLREAGFRLTPQREAILNVFQEQSAHLTPQQVFGRLENSGPSLSLATVYNTLELLEKVGLVSHIVAHDGQTFFDSNVQPHQHAVCSKCGDIFDVHIESDSLQRLMANSSTLHVDDSDFTVEQASVWLEGVCRSCK